MTEDEKKHLLEWFRKADHDLTSAHKLIEDADILDNVCFHCQQAVEKYLKAYLIFKGEEVIKTHYLKHLQTECAKFDSDFNTFEFKDLTRYASDVRYPDDFTDPLPQEAQYYLETAENVKDLVRSKIIHAL
jgi:HEPN domain-containing protein